MAFADELISQQELERKKRIRLRQRIVDLGGDQEKIDQGAAEFAAPAPDETARMRWQNTFFEMEIERLRDAR